MPHLDKTLQVLVQRNARELVLVHGERPVLRFDSGDTPVSRAVLNRVQILRLVSELAGPEAGRRPSDGSPWVFRYRHPNGTEFVCRVQGTNGDFQVRIQAHPAAPEPAGTGDGAGAGSTAASASAIPAASDDEPAIHAYLRKMVEANASDLHLSAGEVPHFRLHGEMVRVEGAPRLTPREARDLIYPIFPEVNRAEFERTRDTDFSHEIRNLARFRTNVFEDRRGVGAVFRVIPSRIPSAADLGIPKAVLDLCDQPKGLVLVTGPTGSGKSTTLAALVSHMNDRRAAHIVTIEDPIEFVHPNRKCLVNQREVHTHTQSFQRALRAALREDPDIVLVGEMRDLETISAAVEMAETGHLVFGTLHTTSAVSTVDRIIDQFPADRQSQIRTLLSDSLRGVVAQTLLRAREGGRVAVFEVLIGVPAVSNLIREGKTYQIPSIMQTGRKHGMVLMNDSLVELVRRKEVTPEEAYLKAVDKVGLVSQLRSAGITFAPTAS